MSKLVTATVFSTITKMAVPMLAGTFAINMYNLTNAWFVSRLGTDALAAISYSFPVIMLLMFISRGVGSGALTLVAHAIGAKDRERAATLTSHALLLAFVFGLLTSLLGIATVEPLFRRLGASGEVLRLTCHYMTIWYTGAAVMVLHMLAADVVIATGDTKKVSLLMVGGTVVNAFLDFVLIFGKFGLPKMGIAGAAVATIFSEALSFACALYILRKESLISFHLFRTKVIFESWGKILKFGIPGALGMVLTPISSAVIIHMVGRYGNEAVAACGVASRIEMFAFIIPMTVGMSLIPFVAQNYGASRLDRIKTARIGTMTFAVCYGFFIAAVFAAAIDPVAKLFSEDQMVINILRSYIFITCAGYGFLEVHRYAGFILTGIHEPLKASVLDAIRILVLLIPFSLLGDHLFQLQGIFWGRLATDFCAGAVGIAWSGRALTWRELRPNSMRKLSQQPPLR